jgi:uncharacterized SAM-binding protein YcdF (DUF218 family)
LAGFCTGSVMDFTRTLRRHLLSHHKLLEMLGAVAVLGLAVWFGRAHVLRSAAEAWVVSDRPGPADAVAVFGGGVADRPFAAAEYYREGLVKKVLVSSVRLGPAEQLGIVKPDAVANREMLLKLGVPNEDIEYFGDSLSNTHEEAVALHAWAERTGARTIIVPTEIFAARRVRWTLRRAFGSGFTVEVPALEPMDYHRDDWWQHEQGVIALQNEILKYFYYRIKY